MVILFPSILVLLSVEMKTLFVLETCMVRNFFHLNLVSYQINNTEIEPTNKKRKTVANESHLQHLRLGHINPNRI
jgi:hypothetical protein